MVLGAIAEMYGVGHSRYDISSNSRSCPPASCLDPVPSTPLASSGHGSNIWFLSTYHSLFLSSIPSFASVLFSFVSMFSSVWTSMSGSDRGIDGYLTSDRI